MDITQVTLHQFNTQRGAFAWAAVLIHDGIRCKLYRTDGVWFVELN